MVRIPDFQNKWIFYKRRADRVSPYFAEFQDGRDIRQDDVAKRIPESPNAPLLQDDGGRDSRITGAAVGNWLRGVLPDERIEQWKTLTGISISLWTGDNAGFERAVRRAAGEVLGWQGLVQERSTPGRIRIRVVDRQSGNRFFVDGIEPADPQPIEMVWPECIARVEVPIPAPRNEVEDRRVWMLADYVNYNRTINLLDPVLPPGGPTPSSRLDRAQWRPGRGGGHVTLPRGEPGYVWIPPSIALGTLFDLLVLVTNFEGQPDEIRNLFEGIERKVLVNPKKIGLDCYQKILRSTLDDTATLLDDHDIRHTLYAQRCEVVSRGTALGAEHG